MSATLERPRPARATKPPAQVFTWANGFCAPVKASVFKQAWEALAKKLGHTPSPAELVAAARQRGHVLHDCFDWDVEAAAAAHWITEAQQLIRNLRVTYQQGPVRNMPMRALFRVTVDDERSYVGSDIVLHDTDLRGQVIHAAQRELRTYTAKYMVLLTAIGATVQAAALEEAIEQAVAAGS